MTVHMKAFLSILLAVLLFTWGCAGVSHPPAKGRGRKVRMVVTAYDSCAECTGWRRKIFTFPPLRPVYTSGKLKGRRKRVGIAADGTRVRKGTIAADTTRYPFGTRMYVPGYGWGVVHDRGSAIKGNHIDLYFSSHKKALKWGRKVLKVTVIK